MKLYRDSAHATMDMAASVRLCGLLKDLLKRERVTHVLETGTYKGLGSTRFVAEAFPAECPPQRFVTIESSWESWRQARRNLSSYPFVTPLWGKTVSVKEALRFLDTDEMLKCHENVSDVYIDDALDPVRFYRDEVLGKLGKGFRGRRDMLFWLRDLVLRYGGNNLLRKYLCKIRTNYPLVVLDSAGGIGYLEFSILQDCMRNHGFYLLLDDINHIKHFRSYKDIKDNLRYEILGVDEEEGWLLAKYNPSVEKTGAV